MKMCSKVCCEREKKTKAKLNKWRMLRYEVNEKQHSIPFVLGAEDHYISTYIVRSTCFEIRDARPQKLYYVCR